MKRVQGEIVSSATDLATFMGCRHAIALYKKYSFGELDKSFYYDLAVDALNEHGKRHEQQYLEHFQCQAGHLPRSHCHYADPLARGSLFPFSNH